MSISKRGAGVGALMRAVAAGSFVALFAGAAAAQEVTAYKLALAEAAAPNDALSQFYRARDYAPLWTGDDAAPRREALLASLSRAEAHGLPVSRYDPDALAAALQQVRSERERGRVEAKLSLAFLAYARDISSGVVDPRQVDSNIVRDIPRPEAGALLEQFADAAPAAFLRGLLPDNPEYARLFRAAKRVSAQIADGGWGAPVPERQLSPGDRGADVVALRDRLLRMGYLERTASQLYDGGLQAAVQTFQQRHDLEPDGIADSTTLAALNIPAETRLRAIRVAMERERWLNIDRGARHIWVNMTDFSSRIIDHGSITFETKAIIGERGSSRQTPEFSDEMTYMEINPDWTVPRSIMARSYLPGLRANPYAHPQFEVVDQRGRVVSRGSVNFAQYSARTFPFNLRQPPGPNNALGQVKFMFPNDYAIYLHDTPTQHLFDTEVRTHSNGCVRLADPYEFAYELLAPQEADPQGRFHRLLDSGQQTRLHLDESVPIHLVYRTAFTDERGAVNFRDDVYGRDAAIHEALRDAGVASIGVQS